MIKNKRDKVKVIISNSYKSDLLLNNTIVQADTNENELLSPIMLIPRPDAEKLYEHLHEIYGEDEKK